MSLEDIIRQEGRLIILRTLADQVDGRLNSELLRCALESFGIAKPRAWVHDELAYLAEMGAVTIVDAASVKVATLTDKGQRHVDRKFAIEGVKRPSLPGA
jgi:hypothetical protein